MVEFSAPSLGELRHLFDRDQHLGKRTRGKAVVDRVSGERDFLGRDHCLLDSAGA